MRLRRLPFDELARRQLDLFATDEAELLDEAEQAEARWQVGRRDDAEERYGDYQLVVDAIADRLLDMRETYAQTIDETSADAYRATFGRIAAKRFRRYASLLADLDDTA